MAHVPERKEDMSSYTEGQVHQSVESLERRGEFTSEDLTKLGQLESHFLKDVRGFIRGTHTINPKEFKIDFSTPLELESFITVEKHHQENGILTLKRVGETLILNNKEITLFLSEKQKQNHCIDGSDFLSELKNHHSGVSVKVLYCLQNNPALWPDSWKNNVRVYFWGDIFNRKPPVGGLYVEGGRWCNKTNKVCVETHWLENELGHSSPAAILA